MMAAKERKGRKDYPSPVLADTLSPSDGERDGVRGQRLKSDLN